MSFTKVQVRQLRAPVRTQSVKEREVEGKVLHYLEGWHVIAEANRIFGFDGWDRETVASQCVWQKQAGAGYAAAYLTRVRVSVRAGDRVIHREGLGSGEAMAGTPGAAHERASKTAETDATKRALSTFGNSFGLSLYRDKTEAPKPARARAVAAKTIDEAASALNGPSEMADDRDGETRVPPRPGMVPASLPVWMPAGSQAEPEAAPLEPKSIQSVAAQMCEAAVPLEPDLRARIEKSALPIGEPKRIRSREHLRFVAAQPCLACGRTPSQAHHLRFAQPRALGRKVSDEFTVPLCATHHHDLHMRGNERAWWEERGLDPLSFADELWRRTRVGEVI